MINCNAWKHTALSFGIGWSLLWSFVLANLPFTPQLNLSLRDRPNSRDWLFPILLLGSFGLLGAGLYWARWLLPVPLILLTWGATVFSILISIELILQKKLINQQQCEIDRLQTIEQAAVISQARKLMHRLASDIHDGPLQELKLITVGSRILDIRKELSLTLLEM